MPKFTSLSYVGIYGMGVSITENKKAKKPRRHKVHGERVKNA